MMVDPAGGVRVAEWQESGFVVESRVNPVGQAAEGAP